MNLFIRIKDLLKRLHTMDIYQLTLMNVYVQMNTPAQIRHLWLNKE